MSQKATLLTAKGTSVAISRARATPQKGAAEQAQISRRMFPRQNGQSGEAEGVTSAGNGMTVNAPRVPAVLKAFKLLETISLSDKPLGVSELSRQLQMGKSTVHGLVTTLEALGVLEAVNGSKRYVLGPRLSALCARGGNQADLRQVARPALERLAAATEQTSFLGVPADGQVTILDIAHGRPTLSISAPVGSSIPLLAGAVGKVVLASWDPKRRRSFLEETVLPAFTPAAIVNAAVYEQAVAETISRGAAVDVDEYVDGIRAAAAPVIGAQHQLVAVLWVAGFARHIDESRLELIASEVKREAAEISGRLGVVN